MPRKRWFGNNFSLAFIEERIRGLQRFIDAVTKDEELLAARSIRDFFCLDEPPSYNEIGEESRVSEIDYVLCVKQITLITDYIASQL